jgi:hypothetical protein
MFRHETNGERLSLKSPVAATSVPGRAEILPSLQPRRYNHQSPPESLAHEHGCGGAVTRVGRLLTVEARGVIPAAARTGRRPGRTRVAAAFDGETAGAIQGRIAAGANAACAERTDPAASTDITGAAHSAAIMSEIVEGRFPPGGLLAGRYRITSLVGAVEWARSTARTISN